MRPRTPGEIESRYTPAAEHRFRQRGLCIVGLAALAAAFACGSEGGAARTRNTPDFGTGTPGNTVDEMGSAPESQGPAEPGSNETPIAGESDGVSENEAQGEIPLMDPGENAGGAENDAQGEIPLTETPGETSNETPPVESPPVESPPVESPPTPTDLPQVGTVEDSSVACPPVGQLTGFGELPDITSLPDPFLSLSGERITTRAEWTCRRGEISALAQQHEFGEKPQKPASVTGALNGNQLTVTASEGGTSVNFSVPISRPAGAQRAIPAVITIGGSSLADTFSQAGVAVINLNNGQIGAQNGGNSRGTGIFYDLYGSDIPTGSLMAWAWGVSRIIDALEVTPQANIDPDRIAVTGCSRNGKGALVVGAFDERIALTVPQESGAGGSASWRISEAQMESYIATVNPNPAGGEGVQTLSSAAGEQPWFRDNFFWFGDFVNRLPIDQHLVMAMVAPRALFVIDNTSMQWLGDESSFTSAVAAHEVWNALGIPDAMGVSQVGDDSHCSNVPQSQLSELRSYIDKFLVGGGTGNTAILRSDGPNTLANRDRWITWSTPTLQ